MNQHEFEALYREHAAQLAAFLARRVDRALVEDLAADVIEIAWRKRNQAEPEVYLGWLFGIAARVVANHRRKSARRSAIELLIPAGESAPSAETLALSDSGLSLAWSRLSSGEREILALAYFEELSHHQIATALNLTTNAVGIRVHRAKNKLENFLKQERFAE
jgi:RNA polymerase sigma-70 factor (ECF subfamily)